MSYIPSQTLDVVRPMRGERSGVDFPSQAEDRLYTLIPIYHNGTMQKSYRLSFPFLKSIVILNAINSINSTTIQNTTTVTTLSLLTPPNQYAMAQFLARTATSHSVSSTLFSISLCQLSVWPGIFSDSRQGNITPCKNPTTYNWGRRGSRGPR